MTDRLTVVTGAAAGIGRSIAAHLLNEGSRVVGLDIRPLAPFDTDRWTGLVCHALGVKQRTRIRKDTE